MPSPAVRHGHAVTVLTAALVAARGAGVPGIPEHRYEILASAFARRGLPIAILNIQREDK
ncbi:MAG TPA: hypothetical protein VFI98_06140 [Pseudolabrys sp.]|jgi:hypothetical protein|nr:hypothetical protein [Pseudolabrys sp.]